jgi:hypothetical protein
MDVFVYMYRELRQSTSHKKSGAAQVPSEEPVAQQQEQQDTSQEAENPSTPNTTESREFLHSS